MQGTADKTQIVLSSRRKHVYGKAVASNKTA